MVISSSIAAQIVEQLANVIEPNINLMDTQGYIIASTDPLRVGTIHGGALRILNEHLNELIIERDDEYPGAKNGINLPIEFNNQIVGIVGLTGRTSVVQQYGRIIKKMTEVLLMEMFYREQKNTERMAIERFLEEWVFGRYDINHPREFRYRAESLGINIDQPRRLLIISARDSSGHPVSEKSLGLLYNSLGQSISRSTQSHCFRTSTLFVCLLNQQTDQEIIMVATQMRKNLEKACPCELFIGIDSSDPKTLKTSFKNANIALQVAISSKQRIHIYSLMNLDIALGTIIEKHKEAYLNEFFHGLVDEELKESIELLKAYYAAEGSITLASEQLFIHKNTLQYRLNKITEITGYDPRKLSSSYLFIIAIKMYDLIYSHQQNQ